MLTSYQAVFVQACAPGADKHDVTKPRCVLPGVTKLVTRRCSERRFFLRPDPQVRMIFEYLLAHFAEVHGIQVHAYVVMSNHYHLVVTDTLGKLPDFQRDLNSLLARSINAFRGRWESFWDRRSYSAVSLLEEQDVLAKLVYTLANPVEARLVEEARDWEGATSAGMAFGRGRPIRRPEGFFAEEGLPEVVELELTRPPCFEGMSNRELFVRIEEELARVEVENRGRGRAMGMRRVMSQDWNARPKGSEERRQLRPTIAGRNKWARIEALQRSKAWLVAYYEALRRFVAGEREVVFPRGTWRMGVRFGCRVALE